MTEQRITTSNGFIKLHRDILQWEWWEDKNTFRLFTYCLLKANYTDKKWQGILIKRGSFITSYVKLSKEVGLGVQQVRTSLNKLKSTGEITSQTTSRNQVLIINNYDLYQSTNTPSNKQVTGEQQTSNKQVTTTKKVKKIKKEKKESIPFEDFYLKYPKKVSKEKAKGYWDKMTLEEQREAIKVVNSYSFIDSMEEQKTENGDFRKHPSTWLYNKCWEDELEDDMYIPTIDPKEDLCS